MAIKEKIELIQAMDKDPEIARPFLERLYGNDIDCIENNIADLKNFKALLWLCIQGEELKGIAITRIDIFPNGNTEFVIAVAVGKVKGASLIDTFLEPFENMAKRHKCSSLRVHGINHALARMYERNGYEFSEIVYKKEL